MQVMLRTLSDGPDLTLDKPVLLLGRHEECDVQLNSSKISRRHCVIANVNDRIVIRDLGSTNGVRINGEAKDEGELHHNDELTIGNFRYCVNVIQKPPPTGHLNVSSEVPLPLPDNDSGSEVPLAKRFKD